MKKTKFNNKELEMTMKKINYQVEQDREKIIDFFSKLTQCETPSIPEDTRSAINLIKDFLDKEGLCYQEIKANKIMPNIISTIDMDKPGRHFMFIGHLDVTPVGNEP